MQVQAQYHVEKDERNYLIAKHQQLSGTKRLTNNNEIDGLYQEFIVLKEYLDSSSKKKIKSSKRKRSGHKNVKNSNDSQLIKYDGDNKVQHSQQKERSKHILNTPQVSRKYLKKIQTSQQQNSDQQHQKQKNHLFQPQQSSRSQLIAEYTQIYQYSIRKVIQCGNNSTRRKNKRRRYDDSQQQQKQNIICEESKQKQQRVVHDFKVDNIMDKEKCIKESELARRLVFNNNNHTIGNSDGFGMINFKEQVMAPFQSSLTKVVDSFSSRLQCIDNNLAAIKLLFKKNELHNKDQQQKKTNMQIEFNQFHQQYQIDDSDSQSMCSQNPNQQIQ